MRRLRCCAHSFSSPPANWDLDAGVSFANDQLVIAAVSGYVLADTIAEMSMDFGGSTLSCNSTNPVDSAALTTPEVRTGTYGVSTQHVDARFDYLILYEPAP